MLENETDPKKIAILLIEEHGIKPGYALDCVEDNFVEMVIDFYVKKLSPNELLDLILHAENDIPNVEEFVARLYAKRLIDPESKWLELFQCAAEFIVARALETQFAPVAA